MNIEYQEIKEPNREELKDFFRSAFDQKGDQAHAETAAESHVGLDAWLSVDEMIGALAAHGALLEARTPEGQLVGALYLQKENPVTWQDGRKVEAIIMATRADMREQGIGEQLSIRGDNIARRMGASAIVFAAHASRVSLHEYYKNLGYARVGTLKGWYVNGDAAYFKKDL